MFSVVRGGTGEDSVSVCLCLRVLFDVSVSVYLCLHVLPDGYRFAPYVLHLLQLMIGVRLVLYPLCLLALPTISIISTLLKLLSIISTLLKLSSVIF